eukprot:9501147-Pyramimonas_sp.AAC.1
MSCAAALGLAEVTRRPERAKGSHPDLRPVADTSVDREPQSIRLRRLRRLERCLLRAWGDVRGPCPALATPPASLLRRWGGA